MFDHLPINYWLPYLPQPGLYSIEFSFICFVRLKLKNSMMGKECKMKTASLTSQKKNIQDGERNGKTFTKHKEPKDKKKFNCNQDHCAQIFNS